MTSASILGETTSMFFAGVGGQIDFLRGAALSHDGLGKPILAMPSVTKRGESKIVPFIKQGIIFNLDKERARIYRLVLILTLRKKGV